MSTSPYNKYRTFDSLLADVMTDFKKYSAEGMIEPAELFKVAVKVNYECGLKINQDKEYMLEINNRRAKLPNDFYILNYALLANDFKLEETEDTAGLKLEYVGKNYEVVQTKNGYRKRYTSFVPFKINRGERVPSNCPNTCVTADRKGWIKNGHLECDFHTGQVFISYLGGLEDEDGNLLVLDHPVINEYYEYALKERVLENLLMNDENVLQKLQYVGSKIRPARNNALSIARTPDFAEFQKVWEMNRKAQYRRFYQMFE